MKYQKTYDHGDRKVYASIITIQELRKAFKIPKNARVTVSIVDVNRMITVHISEIDVYWQQMKRAKAKKGKK